MHSGAAGELDSAQSLLADPPYELPDLPQQMARHRLWTGLPDQAIAELDEARRCYPDDYLQLGLDGNRLAADQRRSA